MTDIYDEKKTQSIDRLTTFAEKLRECKEINGIDGLTIFTSGSYARNEASKFSDIDLFFLVNRTENGVDDIKLKSIQLFAKIIEISQELSFPAFSNDGEYLKLIRSDSILENLGGQRDDYDNHFTTRMLFLLESKCIYNERLNDQIMEEFIESYFRDYPRHPSDFKPIFLINDIIRFWKTLCLNYENKRNQRTSDKIRLSKQKIKNFKLKFSRMLTCFATIANIVSRNEGIIKSDLIELTKNTPMDRLMDLKTHHSVDGTLLQKIREDYAWFLEITNIPETELISYFQKRENKVDAFLRADKFGEKCFD